MQSAPSNGLVAIHLQLQHISACVGVSVLDAEDDIETIIYKSDIDLYIAKNAR